MNTRRFLLCLLCLLISGAFLYGEEAAGNFDICDFYDYPFVNEKFPEWFDDYDELKDYFAGYKFTEKEVANKFTDVMDKEITVDSDKVSFIYYQRMFDGKIFKKFTAISSFENVRYGFSKNMKLSDIVEICGEDYKIRNFDDTIDVNYFADNRGEIHFLLDKSSKKLKAIAISIET